MHRCLTIVEVQRSIFREVHGQSKGYATLARLARTCRAFHSAALDSLWASLITFTDLVQCLPRDLWMMETGRRLVFQRPMSLSDWETFFRYSSRIRTLGYPLYSAELSDDAIYALSNPPTHGPLVPYLKELHWSKTNKKLAPLLRLLLTPCLVSLTLSNCSLRAPEVSILTCIGTMCPSLKHLHFAPGFPVLLDLRGQKILSEALLYLRSLESLTCPALNEAAIVHLSRLPYLTDLSFELRLDIQLENVRPFMSPPAFASVESLTVHAKALSTLTSLLESMRLTPHGVSFVVADTPTPEALRLFFIVLVSTCGSESLTRLSLTTSKHRQRGVAPQQITLSVFQPLFKLPNVEQLSFDAPCNIALDDNAIAVLTKHWPKLSLFSMNQTCGWGITSRVTHRGFVTLLSNCPDLFQFALSVDFSEIDVCSAETPLSRIGHGVSIDECVSGNFVTSAINNPVAIAAFLSDVCPDLEETNSSWYPPVVLGTDMNAELIDVYRDRWEEVEGLLPAFTAVRKQTMDWVARKVREESNIPA